MNAPSPQPPAVRTTCPYCGVGCGVLAQPDGYGGAGIAGDPHHPANLGRICSKGSALGETLGLDGRLLHPMLRQFDGSSARVDWSVALDRVADGFQRIIRRDGPDAVAFYLSGQLLTEDYYVANKLMKGFIGSGNVDTNSRLCMASSVAGHKRAFGADTVPGSIRGSRHRRPHRARRLERRLVPSGAVPAHGQEQARARRQDRGDRSAPHRHRGRCRPVSSDRGRDGHRAVLRAARASRRPVRARLSLHRYPHRRLRELRWRARARSRPTSPRPRGSPACRGPMSRASSNSFVPSRTPSPASRRA